MKTANVRLFALAAAAATFALLPLSGCGSGGSSPINTSTTSASATLSPSLPTTSVSGPLPNSGPTPSPSPSGLLSTIPTTSQTGVTTRAIYDDPAAPKIDVSFAVVPNFNYYSLVEYHIYRNDVIVARLTAQEVATVQSSRFTYTDTGSTPPFAYQQVIPDSPGSSSGVSLATAQSEGPEAFSANTPVVYRITIVGALNGTGAYSEPEIGRSNTITPFR